MVAAPALGRIPVVVDQKGRPVRGTLHTWIARAKVPLPTGRIQIRRVPCPLNGALAGCVFTPTRVVFLRPSAHEPRPVPAAG